MPSNNAWKDLRNEAEKVFGSKKTASDWMKKENSNLGGEKPGDLAQTCEGMKKVRAALGNIEYKAFD